MSTSLDILLQTSPARVSVKTPPLSTGDVLEGQCLRLIHILNSHNLRHPYLQQHLASDFSATGDSSGAKIQSRQDFIDAYRDFTRAHPTYRLEALSVSSEVDEERGLARTWLLARIYGYGTNVSPKETVTVLCWRRTTKGWQCYQQTSTRGVQWDGG